MAYTGTGTEQDPYLVSTMADFVECASKSMAYVKVIANIDASKEAAFKDGYTSAIELNAYVYADGIKKIENVTIQSGNMLIATTGTTIENIFFNNWNHHKTKGGISVYAQYSSFRNCYFSMDMNDDTFGCGLLGKDSANTTGDTFINCVFHVRFTSGTLLQSTFTSLLNNVSVNKCTFWLENFATTIARISDSRTSVIECTFVGDVLSLKEPDPYFPNPVLNLFAASSYVFSKNVFAMHVTSKDDAQLGMSFNDAYWLIDTDIWGNNVYNSTVSSSCHTLKTEQIKSREFLEENTDFFDGLTSTWLFNENFEGYPHPAEFPPENPLTLMLGSVPVQRAYLGTVLVWKKNGINKFITENLIQN